MARTIDLRLPGVSFEAAVKRMIATPPPKKAKQPKAASSKPHRKRTV